MKRIIWFLAAIIMMSAVTATKVSVKCEGDVQMRINLTELSPSTKYDVFLGHLRFSGFTSGTDGSYSGTHEANMPDGMYQSISFRSNSSSVWELKIINVSGRCGFKLGSGWDGIRQPKQSGCGFGCVRMIDGTGFVGCVCKCSGTGCSKS